MQKQLSPEEALHRAAALCSAGEQCIFDIREKLLRWPQMTQKKLSKN